MHEITHWLALSCVEGAEKRFDFSQQDLFSFFFLFSERVPLFGATEHP
jgi:hypothetical protein